LQRLLLDSSASILRGQLFQLLLLAIGELL
jgi:hypothetical protein